MKPFLLVSMPLLLVSSLCFATIDEEFDAIKNTGKNFEVSGTVCEEVARHQFTKTYRAPEYSVVTGIAYGDDQQGVVGELDVIVFETKTQQVVKISEVKCWRDFRNGLAKAHEQRQRFLSLLHSKANLFFKSTSDKRVYSADQFANVKDFSSIAQRGAKAAGFEDELEYSLEDMMGLRDRMLQCQGRGRCPKSK